MISIMKLLGINYMNKHFTSVSIRHNTRWYIEKTFDKVFVNFVRNNLLGRTFNVHFTLVQHISPTILLSSSSVPSYNMYQLINSTQCEVAWNKL